MKRNRHFGWIAGVALLAAAPALPADAATNAAPTAAPKKEQPFTPGGRWRAHDMSRPRPVVVEPGTASTPDNAGRPPADAIILFDGKDLSKWKRDPRKGDPDPSDAPKWKIENGYMEIVPKGGSISTREKFADSQIHIEWATPAEVKGNGQGRGNSGVFIVGHPEIQVLDSYGNDTYPDGQAAGLYGQYPPLVNASRKPGEWQVYDIVYIAPRLDEQNKVVKPALFTVFHNGVLVHHAVEVPGTAVECPLSLQDHNNPVRYRNIWVRKLGGYDEP